MSENNKIWKTDREWYTAAKKAIDALPPRANKDKIAHLIKLWNDRVPEFFRRAESPANAASATSCGKCIARYQEVFAMRFAELEKQFAQEDEAKTAAEPNEPKPIKKAAKKTPKRK
jgi:hypothetical protein